MSDIRMPQNPGIGGLQEFTSSEKIFLQNLTGLSYAEGDLLYFDGANLTRLPIGSAGEVLKVNAGGTAPEWDTGGGAGTWGSITGTLSDQTDLQTALDAKAPLTSPTFAMSITGSYLTASEMLITDASKNIVSAPVATYPSLTELTYVKGVTSAIQTQIDTKEAALTFSTGLTRSTNTITANISTGIAGSQTIYGGTAANEDLTIEGTSNATKTTSYVILQPSGGNVGIGTTTPTRTLSVSGILGSTPIVYIGSPGTSQTLSMGTWYGGATANSWIDANGALVLNPSGGGNVGIGTVSPNYNLHIETSGSGSTIGTGNWDDAVNLFVGSGYNGGVAYNTGNQVAAISSWTGEAGLTLMVNNVYGWLQAVDSSGNFQLRRGFAGQYGTAISVNTAGNVGFANTSPSALLTLGTAGTTAGTLSLAGGTSGVVTLQTAAAAGTYTLTLPTTDGNASEFLQTDGSGVLTWAVPTGTGANTALSNLASVAINTTLVSDTDNTDDIGTSSVFWRTGYFKTSIELGATDTTIARSAAGVIAVEGVDVVNTTTAQTVTNKRNQPRTASSTSNANLDPDLATANVYYRTTQTVGLTIGAPTGTPVIGETIAIYVDSAGAQTLTINGTFVPFGAAFPASTTAGKTFMMTAQYNGTDWKTLWATAV